MNITVIGGGTWGTALGQVLTDNDHNVLLYDVNEELVDSFNKTHKHPMFDDGVTVTEKLTATSNLQEAIDFSNTYLVVVPTKFLRGMLSDLNKSLDKEVYIINASKGIEPGTMKRISEIVEEEIDEEKLKSFVTLTGPSHAEEVILRKVTALVAVSKNGNGAKFTQKLFNNSKYLRVYSSTDLVTAEVGGSVKNAIALISGASTGLGLGENARAALISRGLREMIRIVEAMGGNAETAHGLVGLGDLIVTASSTLSRNFTAGLEIGRGEANLEELTNGKRTVEGIRSLQACIQIADKYNLYTPILRVAYEILYNNLPIEEAIPRLLSADLKEEDKEE